MTSPPAARSSPASSGCTSSTRWPTGWSTPPLAVPPRHCGYPAGPEGPGQPGGYDEQLAEVTGQWAERFVVFDQELDCPPPDRRRAPPPGHRSPSARTCRARASAPRCWAPTTPSSTAEASSPTWRHPTSELAASTCAMATPTTAARSSFPAVRSCTRWSAIPGSPGIARDTELLTRSRARAWASGQASSSHRGGRTGFGTPVLSGGEEGDGEQADRQPGVRPAR